jgi:hypothetical protein
MTFKVYAVIKGYTDNCTYSAEDFDSLELFFTKEDAELRETELELESLESGVSDYRFTRVQKIEVK